jgi:hypothetical protein
VYRFTISRRLIHWNREVLFIHEEIEIPSMKRLFFWLDVDEGGTKINKHGSLNGFNAFFWVVGQLSNEQCNWLIARSQKQIITFSIYFAFFHLSADLSKDEVNESNNVLVNGWFKKKIWVL